MGVKRARRGHERHTETGPLGFPLRRESESTRGARGAESKRLGAAEGVTKGK